MWCTTAHQSEGKLSLLATRKISGGHVSHVFTETKLGELGAKLRFRGLRLKRENVLISGKRWIEFVELMLRKIANTEPRRRSNGSSARLMSPCEQTN